MPSEYQPDAATGNGNGAEESADFASIAAQQAAQQQAAYQAETPMPPPRETTSPPPSDPYQPAPQQQTYQQPYQQPQQPEPPRTNIVEAMSQRGMNFAPGTTDEQVLEQLSNIAAQNQRAEQELSYFRQQEMARRAEEQRRAEEAQQQAQQAEEAKKPKWTAPTYDESWNARVELDEASGRYIPKTAQDYDAAHAANEWADHVRKTQRLLNENPFEAVKQAGLEDYLEERFQNIQEQADHRAQSLLQDYIMQQQQEQVISQNRGAFYFLDERGDPIPDGQGGYHLTPVGKAFRDAAANAGQYTDPADRQKVFNHAMMAANLAAKNIQNGGAGLPDLSPNYIQRDLMDTLQNAAAAYQQQLQNQAGQQPAIPPQQQAALPQQPAQPAAATPAQVRAQNQGAFMNRVQQYQQDPSFSNTSIAQAAANADLNEDTWDSSLTQASQMVGQGY